MQPVRSRYRALSRNKRQRGTTIAELLSVVAVLGLIMSAIFLFIVFGPYARFRRTTDRNTAAACIDRIRKLIGINLVLGIITIIVALLRAA